MPGEFVGAGNATFPGQPVVAQFWTVFGDDALTSLIQDALNANHDLRPRQHASTKHARCVLGPRRTSSRSST